MVWQALFWRWWSKRLATELGGNPAVGAATCYPNRSGAFGPAAVNEVQALRRSGARWYDLPADNRHSGWGR